MTVIRSLSDYFRTLNTLLAVESWRSAEEAAQLLSVKGSHAQCKFLLAETAATERRIQIDSVFDDIACFHLMVLNALSKLKYAHAFDTQAQMVQLFNEEILQKEKDQNWFMPIFYRICTDLRLIARAADTKANRICDPEKSSYYEQAATYFMKCYRSCVNDVRADKEVTKRIAMLNLTNQLFRIYFRINKLNLLKPLIRAIEADTELYHKFSMADKVTYNYYLGRKAMFDSDLALCSH
ncbi:unnamed protein product [Anisakis simplex]|uniref:KIF-binding protein n=1 Tax=Anisakis simplex TaxID=6269 RepID=A0A0M3K1H8_ANISI|nr:unnamed protein product [Anisakis simplex]